MNQTVSVIIPVYNVEEYIKQCLDSVEKQTYKDLEIICVDDCTPDNSMEIVKDFAKLDKRIKIFNREQNGGLSAARNTGLDNATGEYIYFLDSDDWIESTYIDAMVYAIEKSNADIVYNRNIVLVYDDNDEKRKPASYVTEIKDNNFVDIPKYAHKISGTVWSKLYKRKFLQKNNLRFPEGYNCEDIYYHYAALGLTEKLYYFKGDAYYYRQRLGSITNTKTGRRNDVVKNYELVYDLYREKGLLQKNIKLFSISLDFLVNNDDIYNDLKQYVQKAGEYILSSDLYNDIERFLCNNIINTKDYKDYKNKFCPNVTISYIRSKNAKTISNNSRL